MNQLDNIKISNSTIDNSVLNNSSINEPVIISLQTYTIISIGDDTITAQDLLEIVKLKEKMKLIHPELFTM
jgi:hypothetical protein